MNDMLNFFFSILSFKITPIASKSQKHMDNKIAESFLSGGTNVTIKLGFYVQCKQLPVCDNTVSDIL